MLEDVKICSTGLQAVEQIGRLASRASWVGLGSFGFDTSMLVWRFLPRDSQIVVGLPREQEKHSTITTRLGVLKARRMDLHIGTRDDFHAKYGIFRLPRSLWVMVGSANCTPSPAHEVVVFGKSEELFKSIAKKHERWWINSKFVEPYKMLKLSRQDLRQLSSLTVEEQ